MHKALRLSYSMQVSKNGRVVRKYRERLAKCFVKQFLQYFMVTNCGMTQAIADTSNTLRTISSTAIAHATAALADTTYGLQVGTSATAVNISDYKIGTLILHGTSSGRLQYSSVIFGAPSESATTTDFVITRVFTNNSGGSITINEIAIVFEWQSTPWYFLMARDVLVTPVTLAVGESLTLNYTLTTTI